MSFDRNLYQRLRRKEINNAHTKKYEKTRKGFLMRLYRNMKSRISGIQKEKYHLYKNKSILDRDVFYSWAESSLKFHELFSNWELSGYERKLTPSVDRVNSLIGYEIENMEWVTHSENSRRGSISRHENTSNR